MPDHDQNQPSTSQRQKMSETISTSRLLAAISLATLGLSFFVRDALGFQEFLTTVLQTRNIANLLLPILILVLLIVGIKGDDQKSYFNREGSKMTLYLIVTSIFLCGAWLNLSPSFAFMPRDLGYVLAYCTPLILGLKLGYDLSEQFGLIEKTANKKKIYTRMGLGLILGILLEFISIGVLVGGMILAITLLSAETAPDWLFISIIIFNIILSIIVQIALFPYIAHYFYFAHKLEDQELASRFETLCEKFNFRKLQLWIIPSLGERMVNAMQTGFPGLNLRIFLYETLLDRSTFTEREMEAVLAHELVHAKRWHLAKMVAISLIVFSATMAVNFYLIEKYLGIGDQSTSTLMIIPTALVYAFIQRKFEFEADRLAAEKGYRDELISALDKLTERNLMVKRLPKILYIFMSHADFEGRKRYLESLGR